MTSWQCLDGLLLQTVFEIVIHVCSSLYKYHQHLIQLRRYAWLDHQECDHIKEKNGELNEYKSITLNTDLKILAKIMINHL